MTLGVYAQTLTFYYVADDFVLLRHARTQPFVSWRLFTRGGGDGFFRPVGYLAFHLNRAFNSVEPLVWRGPNVALHLANTLLLYVLAVRLGYPPWHAFFGASVFSVHGTRPEAVTWVAGRFDLLATFFVLACLLSALAVCTRATVGRFVLLALTGVLALLSKEAAYTLPFLAAIVFSTQPGRLGKREWLVLIALSGLTALVFWYRWTLFGGIGGYLDRETNVPEILNISVFGFVKVAVLRLWSVFYVPVNWSVAPEPWLAVGAVGYVAALMILARANARRRVLLATLAFLLAASMPAMHQLLIGYDLQKSRLLYLPSIGFALVLTSLLAGVPSRRRQVFCRAALILFYSLALQHNLRIWSNVGKLVYQTCQDVAAAVPRTATIWNIPGSVQGVYFLGNGLPECVQLARRDTDVFLTMRRGIPKPDPDGETALVWEPSTARIMPIP